MNVFDWCLHGTTQPTNNIPLPTYRANLGYDREGYLHVCEVTFMPHVNKFRVRFDYEELNDILFLKEKVIDREDYFEAQKEFYSMKMVTYDRIPDTIKNYMKKNGIKHTGTDFEELSYKILCVREFGENDMGVITF